jgi:transposase
VFGVHESFIYKLLRQKRDRGDIAPLPHGGGARAKLSADQLRQLPDLVAATPDATLGELREQMEKKARVAVSLSTIGRGLQALGLSRKKSPRSLPKPIPKSAPRSKSNNSRWRVQSCSSWTNAASTWRCRAATPAPLLARGRPSPNRATTEATSR